MPGRGETYYEISEDDARRIAGIVLYSVIDPVDLSDIRLDIMLWPHTITVILRGAYVLAVVEGVHSQYLCNCVLCLSCAAVQHGYFMRQERCSSTSGGKSGCCFASALQHELKCSTNDASCQ